MDFIEKGVAIHAVYFLFAFLSSKEFSITEESFQICESCLDDTSILFPVIWSNGGENPP